MHFFLHFQRALFLQFNCTLYNAKISAELKELQKTKTQYTEQQARQDSFQRRVEDMKKFLKTADCKLSEFDNQLVRQLIQSIKVMSKDKIIIKFKSGLEMEQELATN